LHLVPAALARSDSLADCLMKALVFSAGAVASAVLYIGSGAAASLRGLRKVLGLSCAPRRRSSSSSGARNRWKPTHMDMLLQGGPPLYCLYRCLAHGRLVLPGECWQFFELYVCSSTCSVILACTKISYKRCTMQFSGCMALQSAGHHCQQSSNGKPVTTGEMISSSAAARTMLPVLKVATKDEWTLRAPVIYIAEAAKLCC